MAASINTLHRGMLVGPQHPCRQLAPAVAAHGYAVKRPAACVNSQRWLQKVPACNKHAKQSTSSTASRGHTVPTTMCKTQCTCPEPCSACHCMHACRRTTTPLSTPGLSAQECHEPTQNKQRCKKHCEPPTQNKNKPPSRTTPKMQPAGACAPHAPNTQHKLHHAASQGAAAPQYTPCHSPHGCGPVTDSVGSS